MRDSKCLRWSFFVRLFASGAIASVLLAACGGSDESDPADTTGPAPTTTSPVATNAPSTSTTAALPSDEDAWRLNAAEYRGQDGERFTIECTPDGLESGIWGVETYTDDVSVCTAAVHVGLITFAEGGEVEYEIAPGLEAYDAALGNGVLSERFGRFAGSFIFPAAPPGSGEFTIGAETWQRTASEYRGQNGDEVSLACAPGGPIGSVWGSGTYTDDSSVCTAAVHAGLITVADGGTVLIEIAPGADVYDSTTANGVTSGGYGSYAGSFTFPEDQPAN